MIDFSSIVPGSTVTRYDNDMYDGVQTIMIVTGKSRKMAFKDIGRWDNTNFERSKIKPFKLPGKGTCKTYTVHVSNLADFIMVIPGKCDFVHRKKFADIVMHFLAGKASLHSKIQAHSFEMNCNSAEGMPSAEAVGSQEPSEDEISSSLVQFEKILTRGSFLKSLDLMYTRWDEDNKLLLQDASQSGSTPYGNVYVIQNPLFPHILKVGWTGRSPYERMLELSGTGIPEPFRLIASINCANPQVVEKQIHNHFASVRKYGKKKEFFVVKVKDMYQYFEELKDQLAKVDAGPLKRPKRAKMSDIMEYMQESNKQLQAQNKSTQESNKQLQAQNKSTQESNMQLHAQIKCMQESITQLHAMLYKFMSPSPDMLSSPSSAVPSMTGSESIL